MNERNVVVVGGGVIGLCVAYYVLRSGMKVTVLEREEAEGDSCSHGNAGMVVPSHFIPLAAPGMVVKGLRMMMDAGSPFYIRPRLNLGLFRWLGLFLRSANQGHVERSVGLLRDLNLESRRLFAELHEEGDFGLVKRGLLMLCKTQKGLDEEAAVAKQARSIGLEAEVLDAAATARMDAGVKMNVCGSVHFPADCHLDPARFMRSMRERIVSLGGEIRYGVVASEWAMRDDKVSAVLAGGESFEGDEFVIAGGAWSSGLLKELGWRLPLQAGKGYSLTLKQPRELPELCSIFTEAKVAITPMGGALRFAGTMEIGGLGMEVNPQRVEGILRSVPEYFPAFRGEDFSEVEPWVGLRPVSPDGVPFLGRVPKFPNVIAATGHAMMGLSLAPVTGRVVADLLMGKVPFRDVTGLKLERF